MEKKGNLSWNDKIHSIGGIKNDMSMKDCLNRTCSIPHWASSYNPAETVTLFLFSHLFPEASELSSMLINLLYMFN